MNSGFVFSKLRFQQARPPPIKASYIHMRRSSMGGWQYSKYVPSSSTHCLYTIGSKSIWSRILTKCPKNGRSLKKSTRFDPTFLSTGCANRWRNVILLPKLFWPTVRKNCSSDRELLKFEAENFEITRTINSNSERSEQCLVTECFFNLFLEVSHI